MVAKIRVIASNFGTGPSGHAMISLFSMLRFIDALYKLLEKVDAVALLCVVFCKFMWVIFLMPLFLILT
jgi:hypothetical protein